MNVRTLIRSLKKLSNMIKIFCSIENSLSTITFTSTLFLEVNADANEGELLSRSEVSCPGMLAICSKKNYIISCSVPSATLIFIFEVDFIKGDNFNLSGLVWPQYYH